MSIKEHPPRVHIPVLLDKAIEMLRPSEGESYLDLTAGYGGHASKFLESTRDYKNSVLVDRDENTLDHLHELIQKGSTFLHLDFLAAAEQLVKEGRTFDLILADLGVSSPQLDRAERGFSFTYSGPLDMRMDARSQLTAETIVNTYSKRELSKVIVSYGEERKHTANLIADAIIAARPLTTTEELSTAIEQTIHRGFGGKSKKIHPATRTFQALRIEVNDELGQIERLMPLLPKLLNKQGRVAVISFHSLEDRLVKQYFADQTASGLEAELDIVTKKPLSGADYDVHNPRSRSSKLRVAVKK